MQTKFIINKEILIESRKELKLLNLELNNSTYNEYRFGRTHMFAIAPAGLDDLMNRITSVKNNIRMSSSRMRRIVRRG